MNEQPEFPAEARRWVEKTEHDLRTAECVLEIIDDCPTDTVCFHCQQCAEKYLKALLIATRVDFPRTHDLVLLRNISAKNTNLTLRPEDVQPLNRYSVEARYPRDWDPIDRDEATKAVTMATHVRDTIRALLPREARSKEE
ncbi:MAG: HEPN domain-containing protein [Candidatus Hydrogenedentota bacterium]